MLKLWAGALANTMTDEKEPITIKKYANRRLYNTGTSAYVTLEDLATMVKDGENFVVFDAKSGEDITRSVLAQIIFEQENKEGQSLLPIAFLRQLIRFYGDSMQMLVPRFLEQSMSSLTSQQGKFREQMAQAFGGVGFGPLEDQVRRNMEMFEKTFAMFAPFARGQGKPRRRKSRKARPARWTSSSASSTICRSGSISSAARNSVGNRRCRRAASSYAVAARSLSHGRASLASPISAPCRIIAAPIRQ